MFMSRGHPLKNMIHDGILRLMEAGMITQWMKKIAAENQEVQNGDALSDGDDGPNPLSFEHLKGAFYMITVMLSISGMVFSGEIVYYWWIVKKICVRKINVK